MRDGVRQVRRNAGRGGQYQEGQDQDLTHVTSSIYVCAKFEIFYDEQRPHQGIANTRPLAPLPEPITDPHRLANLTTHRRDRLGGVLREYHHAA